MADDEVAGLLRDERLSVEPSYHHPHPSGMLRRYHGNPAVWAHLPGTGCYLHIPDGAEFRYKFEMAGAYVGLALHALRPPGLDLSEDSREFPIDRMIIDPSLVVILMRDRSGHDDVEIIVP
jgi:hypothetical protein